MRCYLHPNSVIHIFKYLELFDASIITQSRTIFDPMARTCIFVGYFFGVKRLQAKSLFISRQVVFHEGISVLNDIIFY